MRPRSAVGDAPRGRIFAKFALAATPDAANPGAGGGRPRVAGCRWKERGDGNKMAEVPGWFRGLGGRYVDIRAYFGKYGSGGFRHCALCERV